MVTSKWVLDTCTHWMAPLKSYLKSEGWGYNPPDPPVDPSKYNPRPLRPTTGQWTLPMNFSMWNCGWMTKVTYKRQLLRFNIVYCFNAIKNHHGQNWINNGWFRGCGVQMEGDVLNLKSFQRCLTSTDLECCTKSVRNVHVESTSIFYFLVPFSSLCRSCA